MKFRSFLGWSVPVFAAAALVNCTSAGSHEPVPECDEISSVCHSAGETNPDAEVCHEQAHEGDVEQCLEIRDECMALCEAVLGIGGAGGQGGAGGAAP